MFRLLVNWKRFSLLGAKGLRVEFDRQCSTERRHDPLTIMDGTGRTVSIRSGREWSDWSTEIRITGTVWYRQDVLKDW